MRDEAGWEAFVRARWLDVVESLEADGVDTDAARDAAARALARLRSDWGRGPDDPDVLVWAEAREAAGLPVDLGAVAPRIGAPREEPEEIAEPEDPLPLVLAAVRARRGRLGRATLVTAAVLAVLVGASAWWLSRPEPPRVVEQANPVPVPWYADGVLQLEEVAVELPGVDAFHPTEDGVAVRLAGGDLRVVRPDGRVEGLDEAPEDLGADSQGVRPIGLHAFLLDRVLGPEGQVVSLVRINADALQDGEYGRLSTAGTLVFVVCDPDCAGVDVPDFVESDTVRLR